VHNSLQQSFDSADRLTQVVRPSGFTESYLYDGAGQRIRHWNSQFGTGDMETCPFRKPHFRAPR
jgi:YD repeat-containing protein